MNKQQCGGRVSCVLHQASCILHPASSSRRGAHEVACRRAEGHGGVVRELACLIWSMTAVVGGVCGQEGLCTGDAANKAGRLGRV